MLVDNQLADVPMVMSLSHLPDIVLIEQSGYPHHVISIIGVRSVMRLGIHMDILIVIWIRMLKM